MIERDVLREYAQEEKARRGLFAFCCRVIPGFQATRFSEYLCSALERLRPGDRLIVNAPPGHGKSTIVQAWQAWKLGQRPHSRLLTLSASEALAVRNSKIVRGFIQDERFPWPSCKVKSDSSSVSAWETSQGNSVRTFGAGSTITGFRAEYVSVDDVQADEGTAVTRDSLEQWFRNVLSTRLEPDGIAVVIQTRWSMDDLVQRLKDGDSGSQWQILNFEAINESENDPLGRAIGEALWPERWGVDTLLARKAEVGSAYFGTAYQGHPAPAGGRIFLPAWFESRYQWVPSAFSRIGKVNVPPLVVTALDAAQKLTDQGSYSALCSVKIVEGRMYVLEVERDRVTFDVLLKMVDAHCKRNGTDALFVEDAAMGSAIITSLRDSRPYAVRDVKPVDSKEERAMKIVPVCERGEIVLPESARWLEEFETELRDFPAARNSDQVDAFVWAVFGAFGLWQERVTAAKWASASMNAMRR